MNPTIYINTLQYFIQHLPHTVIFSFSTEVAKVLPVNPSIFCLFNKTNHTCCFHALSIVEQLCFFLARRGVNISEEHTVVLPALDGRFLFVVVFNLFCNQCLLPFGQDMTERIGNGTLVMVHI